MASTACLAHRPVKGTSLRKLRRYLEVRWESGEVPVGADEVRKAMGWSRAEWADRHADALRWLAILGWRKCSRKLPGKSARIGFWPPIKPAPVIDEWSELD